MTKLIALVVLLGGCILDYGGESQQCYPNESCASGLVCISYGVGCSGSRCANPNNLNLKVNGVPVVLDGGTAR